MPQFKDQFPDQYKQQSCKKIQTQHDDLESNPQYKNRDNQAKYIYIEQRIKIQTNKPILIEYNNDNLKNYIEGTVLLFLFTSAAIIVAIVLKIPELFLIILGGYLLYVLLVFRGNKIIDYISNLQDLSNLTQHYQQKVNDKGYIKFKVQCYHMGKKKSGRAGGGRVFTHQATSEMHPQISIDQSYQLELTQLQSKGLVLVEYIKWLKFNIQNDKEIVNNAFDNFVNQNSKDSKRIANYQLELKDQQRLVGYCSSGNIKSQKIMFWVLMIFGLSLVYYFCRERNIKKLQINIYKKVGFIN